MPRRLITVRLPDWVREGLHVAAANRGTTRNAIIERSLIETLDGYAAECEHPHKARDLRDYGPICSLCGARL